MNATETEHAEAETASAPNSESAPAPSTYIAGVVTGKLVGFRDGSTPLVTFPGQVGTAAAPARTVVDLHGPHIGQEVLLMFDGCDSSRPIVMGWFRPRTGWSGSKQPDHVQVDVDGERLIVTAEEQLVMRCGSASITLTKAGKVLIRGTYVVSHSTGVNRVRGGSVQLN